MSTSGLQNEYNPPTLDGLTVIEADQIILDGQELNIDGLVPYTGANKTVNLGSQRIQSSYNATAGADLVNLTMLTNSVTYTDTANALTYLNKITSSDQTVAGAVEFLSTVTSANFYANNGFYIPKTTASTHGWRIARQLNGSILKDLLFRELESDTNCLLLSEDGQTVYVGLKCDYSTAGRVAIFDANKKLVSSSVSNTTLSYLDATSSVQTQLNSKASTSYVDTQDGLRLLKAGDTMTGALVMGGNKITTSYTPVNAEDLTRKGYVDSAISAIGSNYLPLSGGALTGKLTTPGVDTTAQINIGLNSNTTPNIKFANSLSHIDNGAGEVYLFTAYQGHISIGRNTTRNASTANLVLGTASTEESEIISLYTDNSAYAPMSFASSAYTFTNGLITITNPGTGYINMISAVQPNLANGFGNLFILGKNTSANNNAQIQYTHIGNGSTANYGTLQMAGVGNILNWTAQGRVGIGITNPGSLLDLYSTTAQYNTSLVIRTANSAIMLDSATNGASGRKYAILSSVTGNGIGAGNFGIYDETGAAYRFMISSAGFVGIGTTSTSSLLTIGNASSGYDQIIWSRTTNQPSIAMGSNYFTYASSAGSWAGDAATGDMVLRTNGNAIRFNINAGGTSSMIVESNGIVTSKSGIQIAGSNVINFGYDQTKENNAGKIGYGTFDVNSLCIVGAGTSTRQVHLWDNVLVDSNLYLGASTNTSQSSSSNSTVRLCLRDSSTGFVKFGAFGWFYPYYSNSIAWTSGITISNAFYKPNTVSSIRIQVSFSLWTTTVNNCGMTISVCPAGSGVVLNSFQVQQFFNVTGSHTRLTGSYVFSGADISNQTGWCDLFISSFGVGRTSDTNDTLQVDIFVFG